MVFSAAAVSDYYIPYEQMVRNVAANEVLTAISQPQHKIQSSLGSLELKLQPVPKLLGVLRTKWAPEAFIVSFKVLLCWCLLRHDSAARDRPKLVGREGPEVSGKLRAGIGHWEPVIVAQRLGGAVRTKCPTSGDTALTGGHQEQRGHRRQACARSCQEAHGFPSPEQLKKCKIGSVNLAVCG